MRLFTGIFMFMLVSQLRSQHLIVQSTAFASGHYFPYRYTCDGENINPGMRISAIPDNTKSLVLIMIDSTVTFGVFDHWVVWNIPTSGKISENSSPGITGKNSHKENKYTGPCPPNGVHEYYFRVYALDALLNLPTDSRKEEVLQAMKGHIISKGELVALFQRE